MERQMGHGPRGSTDKDKGATNAGDKPQRKPGGEATGKPDEQGRDRHCQ
jgi:hypothetical protein